VESVRLAEPSDGGRLVELVAEMLSGLGSLRGGGDLLRLGLGGGDGTIPPPTADDPARSAAALVAAWTAGSPDRVLFVGKFHGATVGLAAGSIDAALGRGRVECCYVEPEAREVGVGTELMGAMVGWFGAAGCTDVDAPALPGDRSSKQLFEAAGFKARLLILHRRLD
jgi:GNAT superfamily N-acetyltransferase